MVSDQHSIASTPFGRGDADSLPEAESEAERIRKQYLVHEASCRQLGWLYNFCSILSFIGLILVAIRFIESGEPQLSILQLGLMFAAGGLGGVYFFVGQGLRKLDPNARFIAANIAGINVVASPLVMLINPHAVLWSLLTIVPINACILQLLLGNRGEVVFSDRYAIICQQTPHIKYRTRFIVIGAATALLIILGLSVCALIYQMLS